MAPKKSSTLPIRRKARGPLQKPLRSWFQTDLQKDRKKYPDVYLDDFYYAHMLQRNILTVQGGTFGLHRCILRESNADILSLTKRIDLAYLMVDVLREYAQAEWGWIHGDPGRFASELLHIAQKVQSYQGIIFKDDGQLAKALRDAAQKIRQKWTENAINQAFLYARRRLIRDIRLIVEEFLPLPERKKSAITNRLSAYLLSAFNIKTHSEQDSQQLLILVRQDRQRNEAHFKLADEMVRPLLQRKITILANHPFKCAEGIPCPISRPPLPPYRISLPSTAKLFSSYSPFLDPSDHNRQDLPYLY